jgi:segregation and condensation protein B
MEACGKGEGAMAELQGDEQERAASAVAEIQGDGQAASAAAELPGEEPAAGAAVEMQGDEPAASQQAELFATPEVPASPAEMPQIEWAAAALELEEDAEPTAEGLEFVEASRALSLIESLLFVSDRPVSIGTIKQLFKGTNVGTKDIGRALESLASDYASSARGISLEEIQGGYQLRTKVDNADFLRRLAKTRPFRLSGPALEALSIVAYKQPIVKMEVDQIRGVESGHLLRALMERGLVSFAGKSELPGKPMQYGTTRKFLEIFGLRNLRELPTLAEIDDLIPEGIGEVEDKPVLADITSAMAQDVGSAYSDGEEELGKITDQLQAIDTTSEFFEQEKQRQRDARDRDRAQDIREALTVGEAVEDKDKRWLERYEAKLLEQEAARAAQAAGLTVPAAGLPAPPTEANEATEAAGVSESAEATEASLELAREEPFTGAPEFEADDADFLDEF